MTAPTKQPLPVAEHDTASAEQPPTPTKQTPYGDDVEEAAELLAAKAHRDAAGQPAVDRFHSITWWRLAHLRAAELLHDTGRGEPLAELAQTHTYREIERLLAGDGVKVSDSTITKLIRSWREWKQAAQRQ